MKKIGFIGTGNMAQAMIKGLKKSLYKNCIYGFDKNTEILNNVVVKYKINKCKSIFDLVKNSNIIIVAVKPHNIREVLEEIKNIITKNNLLISIAAGIPIKFIQKRAGKIPIVRVMPNTPSLIGEGACAYSLNKYVKKYHLNDIEAILGSFCKVVFKLDESKLNAVTALSGSGPAYFFFFVESMIKAAENLKIPKNIAIKLISQTMFGAAAMLLKGIGGPEELRIKVTSKGGTTEKAINFLKEKNVDKLIKKALYLAKKRADELGKNYL